MLSAWSPFLALLPLFCASSLLAPACCWPTTLWQSTSSLHGRVLVAVSPAGRAGGFRASSGELPGNFRAIPRSGLSFTLWHGPPSFPHLPYIAPLATQGHPNCKMTTPSASISNYSPSGKWASPHEAVQAMKFWHFHIASAFRHAVWAAWQRDDQTWPFTPHHLC